VPILENPRHETFSQGLAKGLSADAAYEAAGFSAHRGNAARLSAIESVRARVAELQKTTEAKAEMTRDEAVAMCIEILKSPPSAASMENPLCELKMSKAGPFATFPDKRGVLERLAKLLGWDAPEKHDVTLTGPRGVLAGVLKRKQS
jgi:hypothetical protein